MFETHAVQSKIPCILKTIVTSTPSAKRKGQSFSVEATEELSNEAINSGLDVAIPTEKLDGTCCLVRSHKGTPVLWARLDRKPNKAADKRFKSYQRKHREWQMNKEGVEPTFQWTFSTDLKTVPDHWIPADDVAIDAATKYPVPDANGHVPGWVPVDNGNSQYCWHSSTVDYEEGVALTLRPENTFESKTLEITSQRLENLEGKTFELIGTNVNGNPYGLGSKSKPFHVLVEHGCIPMQDAPKKLTFESLKTWVGGSNVEGVVWHYPGCKLFKLHRYHLKLPWPLNRDDANAEQRIPHLCERTVKLTISERLREKYRTQSKNSLFLSLCSLDHKEFPSLIELCNSLENL